MRLPFALNHAAGSRVYVNDKRQNRPAPTSSKRTVEQRRPREAKLVRDKPKRQELAALHGAPHSPTFVSLVSPGTRAPCRPPRSRDAGPVARCRPPEDSPTRPYRPPTQPRAPNSRHRRPRGKPNNFAQPYLYSFIQPAGAALRAILLRSEVPWIASVPTTIAGISNDCIPPPGDVNAVFGADNPGRSSGPVGGNKKVAAVIRSDEESILKCHNLRIRNSRSTNHGFAAFSEFFFGWSIRHNLFHHWICK